MKTRMKKLFLLAIILLTPNLAHAASSCSYEEQAELNDIVANVKASYEVVDIYDGKAYVVDDPDENGVFPEVDHYVKGFNINILNVTEDIYVKVTNNYNNEEKIFRYQDSNNGIVTFQTREVEHLVTYTIEVYANKYSCIGERFHVLYVSTPIYNSYSNTPNCENNKDFYYCQEFISSENISYGDFLTQIGEYEQKQAKQQEENKSNDNKNFLERIKEFYKNNKVIVYSIGVIIVVMGVTTTVILIKKKRSRVL